MLSHSSQLQLTEEFARAYLSGFGLSTQLDLLLQRKKRKNLAELLGHAVAIETALGPIGSSSGFLEYFRQFKTLRMGVVSNVWSMPGGFHWNSMIRMFLDVVNFNVSVPGPLNGYLTHLQRSLTEGLVAHLNDFGRFTLAAFIFDNRPISFDKPVKIKLPNALPGTNLAILPASPDNDPSEPLNWSVLDRTILSAIADLKNTKSRDSCFLNIPQESGQSRKVMIQKLPVLDGLCGTIVIDSFEPCLNLPSVEIYPRIKDLARCGRFLQTLEQALQRLAAYNQGLVKEMSLITASVTPMDADAGEATMYSGTSSAIFGGCFLSAAEHPLFVAEMLFHEFCHNKLRLLQEASPLISDKYLNRSIFYSPWRDDPRPLDGILHGLFVFSSIADFWLYVWRDLDASEEERAMAQRRVGTLLLQLKFACAEFAEHAELTEPGKVFFRLMNDRIHNLETQTKGWELERLLSFFSGRLGDKTLKEMSILESVPRHKSNWEAIYGA